MMANQTTQNLGAENDSTIDPDDIPVGRYEQHRLANDVIDHLINRCT